METWGACSGAFLSEESCNGIDDDCDGSIDELGTFTCGVGACERTVTACSGGVLASCTPLQPTTTTDGCNEIDDDCDGAVDEDCTGCLRVATTGNDEVAAASGGIAAFRNVQAAIDFADTHGGVSARVCVAAGATCGETATFSGPSGADLTMRNGIDVLGNYESTRWTRCANSTTRLAPQSGAGVLFPAAVAERTVLDGFAIDRFVAESTAAVTVDGGRNVLLSNLSVTDEPATTTTYGVSLKNGAKATVFRSRIQSGRGRQETVAVKATDSELSVQDNCPTSLDTGRCTTVCPTTGPALVGTSSEDPNDAFRRAAGSAVVLQNSPGSRVERSAICASQTVFGPSSGLGISVVGNATGLVVRANAIRSEQLAYNFNGAGAMPTGVSLGACDGAAPWIVDNASIVSSGGLLATWSATPSNAGPAISVTGDCRPVIQANSEIFAHADKETLLEAIRCSAANGVSSRCVVVGNPMIRTEVTGHGTPPSRLAGKALSCPNGSCVRVEQNYLLGAQYTGVSTFSVPSRAGVGLDVTGGEILVDGNVVYGANEWCNASAIGARIVGARGTVRNNRIFGMTNASICSGEFAGVGLATSGTELVVHSNLIGAQPPSARGSVCDGTTPGFKQPLDAFQGLALLGPAGVFRNNVITSGSCMSGAAVAETSATADPAIFENNVIRAGDLSQDDGICGPLWWRCGAVYYDEHTAILRRASDVNALADMTVSANVDVLCALSSDFHLVAGSACIDAGTPAGAPFFDFDGDRRDSQPDIGPDEYVP